MLATDIILPMVNTAGALTQGSICLCLWMIIFKPQWWYELSGRRER